MNLRNAINSVIHSLRPVKPPVLLGPLDLDDLATAADKGRHNDFEALLLKRGYDPEAIERMWTEAVAAPSKKQQEPRHIVETVR